MGCSRWFDRDPRGLHGDEKPTGGAARHLQRSGGPERERRMPAAGYFGSRWKGVASRRWLSPAITRRRKIVGRRDCLAGLLVGPIALSKAGSRFSTGGRIPVTPAGA